MNVTILILFAGILIIPFIFFILGRPRKLSPAKTKVIMAGVALALVSVLTFYLLRVLNQ